jgi:DNA-binding protein H-NS
VASLNELLAQREALEREIESTRRQARTEAVAQVRALMAEHGLTLADLSAKATSKTAPRAGAKAPVKYRDAATGDTWSGRGLQPRWLRAALASGRKISEFQV